MKIISRIIILLLITALLSSCALRNSEESLGTDSDYEAVELDSRDNADTAVMPRHLIS